jgi:hypothetical protein
MNVVCIAHDQGSVSAVEPLARCLEARTFFGAAAANDLNLDAVLDLATLLLCGTSDTRRGRNAEAAARIAANLRHVPCVVIEDFAGNYTHVPAGEPQLLVVDSQSAAILARGRDHRLDVRVLPSPRYDRLRRGLGELRSGARDEAAVLWIGQPETEDSLATLRRLLPALATQSVRVWVRAHPRDAGYGRGAYAGLAVEDVTSLTLEECLARRPRLVITQFSSVAIEAGFWGIPSLNVLFPDAGGRTLAEKKGYLVPPWCEEGAAFLIVDEQDTKKVLDRALGSGDARNAAMQAFDRYFKVHEEGAPALINLLYNQGLL